MLSKITGLFDKLKGFSFFDSFKHATIYFSGTILIQGLGIISLPVMTYFLTAEEYGIANVYLSYTLIASIIFSLNLEWSISRYFLEPDADKKGFLATIFTTVTIFFSISSLFVSYYRIELGQALNLNPSLIAWLMLYAYTNMVWYIYMFIRVVEKKSREMTLLQVIIQYGKFAAAVIGIIYLSRVGGKLYMGKIIGEFAINALAALVLLFMLRTYFNFKNMRWGYLRYALIYSLPLVPYAMGGQILISFDQWYINVELGHEKAGLYSFAYKIGLLMFGLITAFQNASIVQYTKWMDEGKYDKISDQVFSIHKLTVLAGLCLILFSVDLGTLLSAKASFREALVIVPIIVIANIMYGIAMLYARVFNYKKINLYLTIIFITGAIVNVYLNMIFIPHYGYEAAAYTTLFSYTLMASLTWFFNDIWLKQPSLPILRIGISLLPLTFITLLFFWLGWEKIGMDFRIIFIKILMVSIYGLFLYWKLLKKVLKSS